MLSSEVRGELIFTLKLEIGWIGMEWIYLAHDKGKWRTLVGKVLNFLCAWSAGISLNGSEIISFSK